MPGLALDVGDAERRRGSGPFASPRTSSSFHTLFCSLQTDPVFFFPAFLSGPSLNCILPTTFFLQVFPHSSNDLRADTLSDLET